MVYLLQLDDVGCIQGAFFFEAVADNHPLWGKQAAFNHHLGNIHINGRGHFVIGSGGQRGADHFFGGVGFGGVGVVKAAFVPNFGNYVAKNLLHFADLLPN